MSRNIRENIEKSEFERLSKYAVKSASSKRAIDEEPCLIRTNFQRDRDRIIHSKSFRRLKHKTQVFFAPYDDHYRTRMTHTLEVTQIARTIARALNLNEDLTEAMALGHDLGHTPFGPCGEEIMNELMDKGFSHNIQSLRVVKEIEKLNLTFDTEDGILNHSWGWKPNSLEGQVVQLADKIAYINHDIDDSIRANVITENDLPKDCMKYFDMHRQFRVTKMIFDIVENSFEKPKVEMSEECHFYMNELRDWMFKNVYMSDVARFEEKRSKEIIKKLFDYFYKKIKNENRSASTDFLQTTTCDYISGMTDTYSIKIYNELFS